jgi:hypothetical protein
MSRINVVRPRLVELFMVVAYEQVRKATVKGGGLLLTPTIAILARFLVCDAEIPCICLDLPFLSEPLPPFHFRRASRRPEEAPTRRRLERKNQK